MLVALICEPFFYLCTIFFPTPHRISNSLTKEDASKFSITWLATTTYFPRAALSKTLSINFNKQLFSDRLIFGGKYRFHAFCIFQGGPGLAYILIGPKSQVCKTCMFSSDLRPTIVILLRLWLFQILVSMLRTRLGKAIWWLSTRSRITVYFWINVFKTITD